MLTIANLTKTFQLSLHQSIKVNGFENISFEMEQGQFVGIAGPSGIGKSSLLKCIYRTYLPTSGHVWYDSIQFGRVDLASASEHVIAKMRKKEISYVTQFLRVIPRVSAIDVVAERLTAQFVDKEEARNRARDLLRRLQIPEKLLEAFPATFSGGEQQRVNIARAVIAKPRLLILDEPTASLDMSARERVLSLLMELKQEGTTMIGVFHDWEVMGKIADQILDLRSLQERGAVGHGSH